MKTRPSKAVLLFSLALVLIRARLTDQFLATDFGEAAELTLLFVAICAAMIGGLLRLLECAHDEKPNTGTRCAKQLTPHGR